MKAVIVENRRAGSTGRTTQAIQGKSARFSYSAALPVTVCWLGMGALSPLAARAGGAGGHSSSHSSSSHSSSSHSSGSGHSSSYGSSHSSSGGGSASGLGIFISLVVMILVVILVVRLFRNNLARQSGASGVGAAMPPDVETGGALAASLAAIPDFQLEAFREQVAGAFQKIQAAWSAQSLAEVRPFISDGVYQHFSTQFRMMSLLQQRNLLDNVCIMAIEPVAATQDGEYDVLQVRIEASMDDAFVCGLDHSLDERGDGSFVEYWSFIRKRERGAGGGFAQKQGCPSCGAPLPADMGELCRCPYCQVLVNSGAFDWILAEITQEDDYGRDSDYTGRVSAQLPEVLADFTREAPDLAVQVIEDKAGNALMQIMTALATRNPAVVRRFVSDEALEAVSALIPQEPIVFNRLYLNETVLLDAARVDGRHSLSVGLSVTMQRVRLAPGGGLTRVDASEVREGYLMVLERDAGAVPNKGALYQHQCPSCSGAVGDTLDINCQYCGVPLNSPRNEWIVTRFQHDGAI